MKSCNKCIRGIFLILTLILMFLDKAVAKIPYNRPCYELTEDCLTKSMQLGIPSFVEGDAELGLETLDPYYMKKLVLKLPGGILVDFRQGYAEGLRNCVVDYARLTGNTLETQFHCNLTIKGQYKSTGNLFMFPIDGEGSSIVICNNLRINSKITLASKLGDDGQKFLEIKKANIKHYYDGRVTYKITNPIKSNSEMSGALLRFMNDNWLIVAEEFGNPMVEYGTSCVLRNFKRLLEIVPMDQIFTTPVNL